MLLLHVCMCRMRGQGLAMARSFGDVAAESVGVFSQPELSEVNLTPNDQFVVWASDGVRGH